jgi:CRISPR-associated protein Csb2
MRTVGARQLQVAGDAAVPEPARSVFGEWIVFREVERNGAPRIGLRLQSAEDIARAMRGALLHHADDPLPEVLAGHAPDGKPSESPHAAFLALADVLSNKYSSGAVLGTAIVLPRDIDAVDRHAVLRAVERWEEKGLELKLGRIGVMRLERITARDPRTPLDPATWTRPSKRWASVTPVALDKNPGDLFSQDPKVVNEAVERAEEIVADACERIGLPRPKWVEVSRRSLFDAAPKAAEFTPFPRQGKSFRRVCVHVEIRFHEDVAGPVVIGAGRYFGVGVCRGWE